MYYPLVSIASATTGCWPTAHAPPILHSHARCSTMPRPKARTPTPPHHRVSCVVAVVHRWSSSKLSCPHTCPAQHRNAHEYSPPPPPRASPRSLQAIRPGFAFAEPSRCPALAGSVHGAALCRRYRSLIDAADWFVARNHHYQLYCRGSNPHSFLASTQPPRHAPRFPPSRLVQHLPSHLTCSGHALRMGRCRTTLNVRRSSREG